MVHRVNPNQVPTMNFATSNRSIVALALLGLSAAAIAQEQQVAGLDGLVNFNDGQKFFRIKPGQIIETGLAWATQYQCNRPDCGPPPADGIVYWPLKVRCSWPSGPVQQTQYGAFDLQPGQNVAFNRGEVYVSCPREGQ